MALATAALPIMAAAQGVTEAKLQVKEMIASNLKLDEQILKQIEQIATLKAQLPIRWIFSIPVVVAEETGLPSNLLHPLSH